MAEKHDSFSECGWAGVRLGRASLALVLSYLLLLSQTAAAAGTYTAATAPAPVAARSLVAHLPSVPAGAAAAPAAAAVRVPTRTVAPARAAALSFAPPVLAAAAPTRTLGSRPATPARSTLGLLAMPPATPPAPSALLPTFSSESTASLIAKLLPVAPAAPAALPASAGRVALTAPMAPAAPAPADPPPSSDVECLNFPSTNSTTASTTVGVALNFTFTAYTDECGGTVDTSDNDSTIQFSGPFGANAIVPANAAFTNGVFAGTVTFAQAGLEYLQIVDPDFGTHIGYVTVAPNTLTTAAVQSTANETLTLYFDSNSDSSIYLTGASTYSAANEFSFASGGSCYINQGNAYGYQGASNCTLNVAFTPTAPGLRSGTFTIDTSIGNFTIPVAGQGTGSLLTIAGAGPRVVTGAGIPGTVAVAVDNAGNIFSADYTHVYENATTIYSGGHNINSIALDGAGDVYVADPGASPPALELLQLNGGSFTPINITPSSTTYPTLEPRYVYVDPSGDIFLSDQNYGVVEELPPGTVAQDTSPIIVATSSTTDSSGDNLAGPQAITGDAAGSLYVSGQPSSGPNNGYGEVFKISAGSWSAAAPAGSGSAIDYLDGSNENITPPGAMVVDPAGDLILTTSGEYVAQFPPDSGSSPATDTVEKNCEVVGNGPCNLVNFVAALNALAIDSAGNLYFESYSSGDVLAELDRQDIPTHNFGTSSGSTSFTALNIGNASANFGSSPVSFGGTNAGDFSVSSDTCASLNSGNSDALAPLGTCSFTVNYTASGGSAAATVALASDAWDSPNSGIVEGTDATSFTVAATGPVTAGVPFTVTVTAYNGGSVDTDFTGSVSIGFSGSGSASPATITSWTSGVGTTQVTLNTAGSQTVTATLGAVTGTSSAITVVANPTVSVVVFTSEPQSALAGYSLGTIQVTLKDLYGNVELANSSSVVQLSLNSGNSGQLLGPGGVTTITATAQDGVATFTGDYITAAGYNYTLVAQDTTDGGIYVTSTAFGIDADSASAGSLAIGTTTFTPITVPIDFGGSVTLDPGSVVVTTLGGASDFQYSNNGSCPLSSGSPISETSCVATVTFTPSAAGLRQGALTVTDENGDIFTVFLYGVGTGGQAAYAPTSGTASIGGAVPGAVVTDGANVYYAAGAASDEYEILCGLPISTYQTATPVCTDPGGPIYESPVSLAIDGAGDIYMLGYSGSLQGRLYRFANKGGGLSSLNSSYYGTLPGITVATLPETGGSQQGLLATDGAGNVYALENGTTPGTEQIDEFTPTGFETAGIVTHANVAALNSNYSIAGGLSVDANGNLYYSVLDSSTNGYAIVESPAGNFASPTVYVAEAGGVGPISQVDAAGDVYTAGIGTGVSFFPVGSAVPWVVYSPSGANGVLTSISLDSAGDFFVADPTAPGLYGFIAGSAAINFGSVLVDTSQMQLIPIFNIGNGTLTTATPESTGYVLSDPTDYSIPSGDNCHDATLAPGASCLATVTFTPQSAATLNGTLAPIFTSPAATLSPLQLTGSGLAPTKIVAVSVNGSAGATGGVTVAGTYTLIVEAEDSGNNPVDGVGITLTPGTGGGGESAVCVTCSGTTGSDGKFTATLTANHIAQGNTFTVTSASTPTVATQATFTLTNAPGALTQLVFTKQPSNTVAGIGSSPIVTEEDQYGNAEYTVNGTDSINFRIDPSFNPGSTTLQGPTNGTVGSGTASVPAVIDVAGNGYKLDATEVDSPNLTAVSAAFNVVATAPYAVAVNSGTTPQSAGVGQAFGQPLAVTVVDQYSNPVAGITVSFVATPAGNGASATLSAASAVTNSAGVASVGATANTTIGSYSVAATAAGVGTPATFSLTNTAITEPLGTSTTIPVTFSGLTYSGANTLASIRVSTQGATGLDFQETTGDNGTGTCTAGEGSQPTTCTVSVTFDPTQPGLRQGAVQLYDSAGNVVATSFVSGIGQGAVLVSNTQVSTLQATTRLPFSIAYAAGSIFYTQTNGVWEIPAGGGTATQVVTVSDVLASLTLDGAGNIYAIESSAVVESAIKADGTYGSLATLSISGLSGAPSAVYADAAGNLIVALSGELAEVPAATIASGSPTATVIATSAGTSNAVTEPDALTEDSVGNLYVGDLGSSSPATVYEIPAGASYPVSAVTELASATNISGLVNVSSLATDLQGNVYVALFETSGGIYVIPAGGAGSATISAAFTLANLAAMTMDPAGNLYLIGNSSPADENIFEVQRAAIPALTINATADQVHAGTATVSATVTNLGNATANNVAASVTGPFTVAASGNTCGTTGSTVTVAAGAGCTLVVAAATTDTQAKTWTGGAIALASSNAAVSPITDGSQLTAVVAPGAPAVVTAVSVNANLGASGTEPVVVGNYALVAGVDDAYTNPVANQSLAVAVVPPASGASVTGSLGLSSVGGQVSGNYLANNYAGVASVVLQPFGCSASCVDATFSLTNVIDAGTTIVATSGSGQSVHIGDSFASPLLATVMDNGADIGGVTVTFTGPGSGPGISNTGGTAVSGVNGEAAFTPIANGTSGGPYNVIASASLGSPIAFSLTNTGDGFGPGGATHFSVNANSSQTEGGSFTVTVTALNAGNATATGFNGTATLSSSDAAASLGALSAFTNGVATATVTLVAVGADTITATDTNDEISGSTLVEVNPIIRSVGTTSSAFPVNVLFSAGGTLANITFLSQGAANGEYASTGGTCSLGAYTQGESCTEEVTFSPKAPGLREGAIVLTDASNNILATAYVSGFGLGAALAFQNSTAALVAAPAGAVNAAGVAVDANGDIFYSYHDASASYVHEIVKGASDVQIGATVGDTGLTGITLDGAGNVYAADMVSGTVYEIPFVPGTGYASLNLTRVGTGLGQPYGLYVDPGGNLYIADAHNQAVYEVAPGSSTLTVVISATSDSTDISQPWGLTGDATGDLLVSDQAKNDVVQINAGTAYPVSHSEVTSWTTSVNEPTGLAMDAGGNLYVASSAGGTISVLQTPGAGVTVVDNLGNPAQIAVDAAGSVYAASVYNSSGEVFKLDRQDIPTTTLTETAGSGVAGTATFTVSNVGTETASSVTASISANDTGNDFSIASSPADTCTGSLGFGSTCSFTVAFLNGANSTAGNPYSATVQLASNAADSPQSGALTGNVSPGAAYRLVFTNQPAASTAAGVDIDAPTGVQVSIEDQYGNVETGSSDSISMSGNGFSFAGNNPTVVQASQGVASFTTLAVDIPNSGLTMVADDTSESLTVNDVASSSFTITPAAIGSFTVVLSPSSVTAGNATNVTVTAINTLGQTDTSYTGTIHFTSSDTGTGVVLPADYTFVSGNNGVNTFLSGVTLVTAGSQTVSVRDTVATSATGTSSPVTVTAQSANHFVLTDTAANPDPAGASFGFTVTAEDLYGNTDTNFAGTVNFGSTDLSPHKVLPAPATLTHGVGSFNATLVTAGTQTVSASSGIILGATPNIVVVPASTSLVITPVVGTPQSATVGAGFATPLEVNLADQYGNNVSGAGVTFTPVPATDGATATIVGSPATTNSSGDALVTATANTIAGTYNVSASASGAATPASFALTNNPGTATQVVLGSLGSSYAAGGAIAFTATLKDADGNVETGDNTSTVTITFATNPTGATLVGTATATVAAGVASFNLAIDKTGSGYQLKATSSLGPGVTSGAIAVTAGATLTLTTVTGTPQAATVGASFATPLEVSLVDQYGNAVSGATVTFTAPTTGATALLSAPTATTNSSGDAQVTATAGTLAGTYNVSASASGAATPATFALTNNPGPAAKVVGTSLSASYTAGASIAGTISEEDTYGNVETGDNSSTATLSLASNPTGTTLLGTLSKTLTAGQASFSVALDKVGSGYALQVTVGSLSASSTTFSITAAGAASFSVVAPSAATAGLPTVLTLTALDAFGNTASGYAGTLKFTSTDPAAILPSGVSLSSGQGSAQVTFETVGKQRVTVSDSVNASITGTSNAVSVSAPIGTTLTASTSSLTFASQPLSQPSAAETVVIANTGAVAAAVTSITITGADASDFTPTSGCGTSIAAGTNCAIQVVFTPQAAGTRTATLQVATNATNSPQSIGLSGTGVVAGVSVTPAAVNFGSQTVSTTSTALPLTITNTGSSALSISNVATSSGFGVAGSCAAVQPGASCTLGVTFTPASAAAATGTVTLTDNASGGSQTVPLSGTGIAAGITLTPSAISFANTVVGATSYAQTLTLTNSGTAPLTSIAIPAVAGDYAIANTGAGACAATLAAGASCAVSITLTPTVAGADAATLAIGDNLGTQTVALSGTGITPGTAVLSTALVSFGSQTSGTSSGAQTVTLTNSGATALSITSIKPSTGFSENDNCGTSVAAGSSCNINVAFAPAATGTISGTLTISDSAPGSPQTVSLAGVGVSGLSLSPATLGFGSALVGSTTAQQTVNVTNTGTTSLTPATPQLAGAFTLSNNLCTSALAPGATCQVMVAFAPAALGASTGSITLTDTGDVVTASATLSGRGVAPGILATPQVAAFGSASVGAASTPQTVTVTNNGTGPLTIEALGTEGDFAASGTTCLTGSGGAQTLAASSSCVVNITMTATTIGSRTGTLQIFNSANGELDVALTGVGQGAGVTVTPAQLAFGSQPIGSGGVGVAGQSQTVTLTNTGNASLSISSIQTAGGFGQTNTCGTTLAAGASCAVDVNFAPTALGQWTGTLTINDNATASPEQVVTLTGLGSPNGLVMTPATLNFGGLVVGQTSAAVTATLSNNTGESITGLSITASGEFNETNTCGSTLANGSSCTLSVTVTPVLPGPLTGSISISGALSGGGTLATTHLRPQSGGSSVLAGLALAGGGDRALTFNASTLSFSSTAVGTTSAGQVLTVTNTGSSAATSLTVSSTAGFPYTTTCSATLAASGTCTVTVTFAPTLSGTQTGTLTVAAAGGLEAMAALSGVAANGLAISPASLSFAATGVGVASAAQSVTISNGNGTALAISSITASGDFSQTNNCPASLAAGANCSVSVTFKPSATGPRSGTLTVVSSAATQTVALSGTGSDFTISLPGGASSSAVLIDVDAGSSGSANISFASVAGDSQTLQLACSLVSPGDGNGTIYCSFNPATVTVGASGATSVLTITTQARGTTGALPPPSRPAPPAPWRWLLGLLALLGLWMSLMDAEKRRRRWKLALLAGAMALTAACAQPSTSSAAPHPTGTPAGQYQATLTVTSSNGVTHTSTVTIQVN